MKLRDYQQEASDAAIEWIKKTTAPAIIEAPTGSGKSHIIADISRRMYEMSGGKRILCLAPSGELVMQNRKKFLATGNPASIFSASAGGKSLAHPVVFGTPGTVINHIKYFGGYCAVIVDEAHRRTPTIGAIINALKGNNPNLREIGLTATPYRLGTGYIYEFDVNGTPVPESQTKDPHYKACIYTIHAHDLIAKGWLSRPVLGALGAGVDHYDTIQMELKPDGHFRQEDVDRAYHGQGRKTARIVADVVAQSRNRRGVLLFAATVQHAYECMASLPKELTAIITAKTPAKERRLILESFEAQQLKYLVNVETLTTGFDAPHVDVIALLRATESVALLQQIIGRGLRIFPEKEDCLILDYAENTERHCPDGDVFNPKIKAHQGTKDGEAELDVVCPTCGVTNKFYARKNPDKFKIDEFGYFIDLAGDRIKTEYGDMPGHTGRRCMGQTLYKNLWIRCDYRWTSKVCEACGTDNDIAARYCHKCKAELVDPNEKLRIEFKEHKKDPTRVQTDKVVSMHALESISQKGNTVYRVNVKTEFRSFTYWLHPQSNNRRHVQEYEWYRMAINNEKGQPNTITYRKDGDWWKVLGYDAEPDKCEVEI